MKVSFNDVNPGFNGCYKLPWKELDSWERIVKNNLDRNNDWHGVCANLLAGFECGTPIGNTYTTKKAGSVMYFDGNHGLDYIIQYAKNRLLHIAPTKEERKLLNIRRKKISTDEWEKLKTYRFEKAKEMGIETTNLFDNSKYGVYIFTGENDVKDYFNYICKVSKEHSQKYASPKRTFWQTLADKFKPKKQNTEQKESFFYRNLRQIAGEDNYQRQVFDEFISNKEVKEFDTAEDLAKEIF